MRAELKTQAVDTEVCCKYMEASGRCEGPVRLGRLLWLSGKTERITVCLTWCALL